MKVVIVGSNMDENIRNIKTFEVSSLFKACSYKDDESFEMVREWDTVHGRVRVWCKTTGFKSSMNAHLSGVLGRSVYRKSVFCLVGPLHETYIDFDMPTWSSFSESNLYSAADNANGSGPEEYVSNNGDKQDDVLKCKPLHAITSENDVIMQESGYENEIDAEDVEGGGEDADVDDGDGEEVECDADGDEADGDEADGDEADGDEADCDEADCDEADCDEADGDEADRNDNDEDGDVDLDTERCNVLPSLLGSAINGGVVLDRPEATNTELIKQIGLLTMNEMSDDEYFPYSDEETEAGAAASF